MAGLKAEVLASILDDSKNAKNIPGMTNVYTPDEYNKKMAEQRAMGLLEGNDGYLHGDLAPGAIEIDKMTGNLRKINRNKPAILVVIGHALVQGIQNMTEIPKSIKAYRFHKVDKKWEYKGAELISDKQAYEMRSQLNPYDVLSLMYLIRESDLTSNVRGDKLNDIA